ncbi:uncharacterized protein LOC132708308 [Cylas formicarius]|uniref:uncharacterized protein LOC132708308 n=1 Tax=Cylas formicarius TaxID=197179 RepID=UPI002958DF31|nr:uncharacterized protein LOC132708308 [Cylas formicarius]
MPQIINGCVKNPTRGCNIEENRKVNCSGPNLLGETSLLAGRDMNPRVKKKRSSKKKSQKCFCRNLCKFGTAGGTCNLKCEELTLEEELNSKLHIQPWESISLSRLQYRSTYHSLDFFRKPPRTARRNPGS